MPNQSPIQTQIDAVKTEKFTFMSLTFSEMIAVFFCQLLICMLVTCLMVGLYQHRHPPTKIATIDILELSKNQLQKLSTLNLEPEASEKVIKDYVLNLERLLKKISRERALVILPKEAVIEGSEDLTELVQKSLDEDAKP